MRSGTLDLETLLRIPQVDPYNGFDISPDGGKVAFSWNKTGQWEIYELPLTPGSIPQQVTHGLGGKFSPQYSPDGQQLAYMVDFDGGERYDLFLFDFATQHQVNLTPDEPGALQPNFSWSSDGTRIAFLSDRSGIFSTFLLTLPSAIQHPVSQVCQVFTTSAPHWDVHWSPDGRRLAVVGEAEGQDWVTYIVDVTPDTASSRVDQAVTPMQAVHIGNDTGPINAREVAWSPDSTRLAFCSNLHGSYEIGIYEVATSKIYWATPGLGGQAPTQEASSPAWSLDGLMLAFVLSQAEESFLAVLDVKNGLVQTYQFEPGVYYAPHFTRDGDSLLFILDTPSRPDDLWHLSLKDGVFNQLTISSPPGLPSDAFITPEVIHYPSLGGQEIPALLFEPPGGPNLPPAVVVIHGGPDWLFQLTWYPIMQAMAGRGWVVLAPNYRGSSGYGRGWQQANRYDMGGVDTRDVAAGALFLAASGLVDPQRIAVTGRSHGGYLTMTCLTQFPGLWATGSAVVPFLNWFTSHENCREDLRHWTLENMGDPVENYALWYERSPYFFLDRVNSPVQLICGENDPRCPASESLAARNRLRELGKPVELLLYPGEGHSFLNMEAIVDSEVRRLEFLSKALEFPR